MTTMPTTQDDSDQEHIVRKAIQDVVERERGTAGKEPYDPPADPELKDLYDSIYDLVTEPR